jgi:transcription elongation GreA/GreB family factor
MSRGFVKEDDLELAGTVLPERPVSLNANYVTPSGLVQLKFNYDRLEQERQQLIPMKEDPAVSQRLAMVERDLRYFQTRLENIILVEGHEHSTDTVLFGVTVKVEDEHGGHQTFTIVGEDEADIGSGKVSYVSPLAQALIGHKVGESVPWKRPVGDLNLEIIEIL